MWVCMFISFLRKGFYWLSKAISDGMLRKFFCIKYLCCHVIDNYSRNLQTGNCANECQINQAKPRKVKDNSYKLSKKPMVKVRSIATFLLTNLGSRSEAAQGQTLSNCHYTERGDFNYRRTFQSYLISIDSGLDITVEKIRWTWRF